MKPLKGISKAWMKLGGFVTKQKSNVGFAKTVLEFAEFAAKLTPSKKDDLLVAKLGKFLDKAEAEVDKAAEIKKEVDDVVKVVKKKPSKKKK